MPVPTTIDRGFTLQGKSGKGILLLHGLTGVPGEMKLLAKRLHRDGFSVHAPQLAGHGLDRAALLRTTWRDWLETALHAHDRFAQEVDETFTAGICVGGALALLLADRRPAVRATAVYSMTFAYDGWNMRPWYSAIAPVARGVANWPGIRTISFKEPAPFGIKDKRLRDLATGGQGAMLEGALDRLPLGSLYEMYCLGEEVERLASRMRAPTLILHAREDDMSHPRNAERLQRALGCRNMLHLLDDCYHMIHVDRERNRVAELTRDFFLGAAGSSALQARLARA